MARNGVKTGGRRKGTPNKRTAEEIDRANRVLQLIESEYLESDIKKLTPAQRMQLYSDMMEYKVPKLSRTELKGGTSNELKITIVRSNNKAEHPAPNAAEGAE